MSWAVSVTVTRRALPSTTAFGPEVDSVSVSGLPSGSESFLSTSTRAVPEASISDRVTASSTATGACGGASERTCAVSVPRAVPPRESVAV